MDCKLWCEWHVKLTYMYIDSVEESVQAVVFVQY